VSLFISQERPANAAYKGRRPACRSKS